jgi:ATP-dependent DNA helicase RecQ
MTRARETLCLFKRADSYHPHVNLIDGDFLFKREPSLSNSPDDLVLRRRYDILGTEDLFIDYAGQRLPEDPVHKHLSSLESGDYLFACLHHDAIELKDKAGVYVSRLSQSAVKMWRSRLDSVESIKIIAIVHRCIEDSGEEFRSRCRCDHWEIPVVEVVYVERTS